MNIPGFRYTAFLFVIVLLFNSCIKDLTVTNVIYTNDFNNFELKDITLGGWNNGVFGPVTNTRIGNYNGQTVLGKFNNNNVQLQLTNLPQHQALRVEFDLYLHNIWKNDVWVMSFDGAYKLITSFSNDSTVQQSYPNWYGNGTPLSPAGKNAIETYLPGVCRLTGSQRGSSMYRMVTTISHNAPLFNLSCSDAGGVLNDSCQRSWSMDNLKVSIFKN